MNDWVKPLNPDLLLLGSMSKERAKYILNNKVKINKIPYSFKYSFRHEFVGPNSPIYEDGINEVEDAYIKMVWSLMSDDKSYHDAVVKISLGEA
jgi:hypothetical protein